MALQPVAYLPRHVSPSDRMSSSDSSALSPPEESDYSVNDPSTPVDDMRLSPPAQQYQNCLFQDQQLVHMAPGMASDYVKPEDVCFQQQLYGYEERPEPSRAFSMLSTESSFDMGSNYDMELAQPSDSANLSEMSQPIKEEVPGGEAYPEAYPPFEADDEIIVKVHGDDEKDTDYNPRQPNRRTPSTAIRTPRRKRASVPQPASAVKRPKLGPVAPLIHQTKGNFFCKECRDATFKDQSGLQKHIKQQHTRPFVCVFQFAHCDSTFASKNEWKRHVASQHLLLDYWLCQQDSCAKLSNTSGSSTKATGTSRHRSTNTSQARTSLPNGAIFNRKDLYTQHLRRMHVPPVFKKQIKAKKTVPEWEETVRVRQDEAHKLRCDLPDHMTCPAPGCSFQTRGPNAWDERMEHVAKHLEKAASGQEAAITFGGVGDPSLMNWVLRPDVAVVKPDSQGWSLNNPLKPEKNGKESAISNEYGEEDAPGEEVDY